VAPEHGLTITNEESAATDDTSFTAQITKAKASNPDLIYTSLGGRALLIFWKQYHQLGLTIPLAVGASGVTQPFFDGIGGADKADGLFAPAQIGTYGDAAGGDTARLVAELRGVVGHAPSFFNTFGYDSGIIMGAALAHSDGSRQGLRDALEKLKDLPAINGPVNYKPEDHTGQDYRSILVGKLKGGIYVPALSN
jgi:branched-chain amino acid transport system substrate-binding protein